MKRYSDKTQARKQTTFERIENMHPHLMLLYLSIFGICLIFTFLIIAYLYSSNGAEGFGMVNFPKSFVLSTIVLLISSLILTRTIDAYQKENLEHIFAYLSGTFLLGLAYCILQFYGWKELQQNNIAFTGEVAGTYLYLISGLHALHLVGGMVFAMIALVRVKLKSMDPVKTLIFITSPYEMLKLKMLNIYWHFMDALWIVLFLFFLFNF